MTKVKNLIVLLSLASFACAMEQDINREPSLTVHDQHKALMARHAIARPVELSLPGLSFLVRMEPVESKMEHIEPKDELKHLSDPDSHQSAQRYSCFKCGNKFDVATLGNHLRSQHLIPTYGCPAKQCDKRFLSRENLNLHKMNHHTWRCTSSRRAYKTFANYATACRRKRYRAFFCGICSKGFFYEKCLLIHEIEFHQPELFLHASNQ